MPEKYGEFQTEIDLFNKAFAEVMIEGMLVEGFCFSNSNL